MAIAAAPRHWHFDGRRLRPDYPHLFTGSIHSRPAVFKVVPFLTDTARCSEVFDAARAMGCDSVQVPIETVTATYTYRDGQDVPLLVLGLPRLRDSTLNEHPEHGAAGADTLRGLLGAMGAALVTVRAAAQEGHADVRPDNILIDDDGRFTLIDWLPPSCLRVFLGKRAVPRQLGEGHIVLGYLAPRFRPGHMVCGVTWRDDVFALGVCAYEFATGVHPYLGERLYTGGGAILMDAAVNAQERIVIRSRCGARLGVRRPDLPPALVEMVERCLDPFEARRPSLEAIAAA